MYFRSENQKSLSCISEEKSSIDGSYSDLEYKIAALNPIEKRIDKSQIKIESRQQEWSDFIRGS